MYHRRNLNIQCCCRVRWVAGLLLAGLLLDSTTLAAAELESLHLLPAHSFVDGPDSGQFIEPANGVMPPFRGRQPIQGFSSLEYHKGQFLALLDNGFGSQDNSADFVLRMVRLSLPESGDDPLQVRTEFLLSDPGQQMPWPVVADATHYPGSNIAVDEQIRQQRWLTGADLDPESARRMADGSWWLGDEFGPFLLQLDAAGRLLRPPVALPDMQAPQNPALAGAEPGVLSSGGFEGLALDPDGRHLWAMLEKTPPSMPEGRLPVYRFDTRTARYQPSTPAWFYPLANPAHRVADFLLMDSNTALVIERDSGEGEAAAFKRVYQVRFAGDGGQLASGKILVADLLDIDDPQQLSGGPVYRMPFSTIEGLALLPGGRLAVINDNNYPFSAGRRPGQPDATELAVIRVGDSLSGGDD